MKTGNATRWALSTGAALLLLVGTVGTALAHEGNRSCGGGAPGVIETFPEGVLTGPGEGPSGPGFVAPIAKAGIAAATIASLHDLYCHQPPGPPPGPAS